jgi:hypothetical protein
LSCDRFKAHEFTVKPQQWMRSTTSRRREVLNALINAPQQNQAAQRPTFAGEVRVGPPKRRSLRFLALG